MPTHVQHDSAALVGDSGLAASSCSRVATPGAQGAARQALRVHPDQYVVPVAEVAVHQGEVLGPVERRVVADRREDRRARVGMRACAART